MSHKILKGVAKSVESGIFIYDQNLQKSPKWHVLAKLVWKNMAHAQKVISKNATTIFQNVHFGVTAIFVFKKNKNPILEY